MNQMKEVQGCLKLERLFKKSFHMLKFRVKIKLLNFV